MLILMKALMLILLVIQKHNMFFQYNSTYGIKHYQAMVS